MSSPDLPEHMYQFILEHELLTTAELQDVFHKKGIAVSKEVLNSLLYGVLRDRVLRVVNMQGVPAWKIRRGSFEAAGGLEAKLFYELLTRQILPQETSSLGFSVKNTQNGKRYSLDIASRIGTDRYNIEVDGFDHIRADALLSIQWQLEKKGKNAVIEIDWMDHEKSFADFKRIATERVYRFLATHQDWITRYHEELLWPKDITRNLWLIEKGWKIIRFWNLQVRDDLESCVREVKEWIGK